MHIISSAIALLLAGLSAIATANVLSIDTTPKTLFTGDKYEIQWTSDSDYTLKMSLVQKESNGWKSVQTIFDDRAMSAGSDSYRWTVPNVDSSESYGLWLSGDLQHPSNPDIAGYADLTPWFTISGGSRIGNDSSLTKAQLAGVIVAALAIVGAIAGGLSLFVRWRRAERKAAMSVTVQSVEGRRSMDSIDSIEVEKERVRLAAKGMDV